MPNFGECKYQPLLKHLISNCGGFRQIFLLKFQLFFKNFCILRNLDPFNTGFILFNLTSLNLPQGK